MGWFKKKDNVVDLGKQYKERQQAMNQKAQTNAQNVSSSTQDIQSEAGANTGGFGIFDQSSQTQDTSNTDFVDIADTMEGRRKRLAKRIMDMTAKMENLSNQVYHLQQRVEVLERKLDVGSY